MAGRSAYQLVIEPRTSQSLIDRIVIAVDGQTTLPLQLQVFARGVGQPGVPVRVHLTELGEARGV